MAEKQEGIEADETANVEGGEFAAVTVQPGLRNTEKLGGFGDGDHFAILKI